MLVDHVSPPVVFPGETLASHFGVQASRVKAVELVQFGMLVVDMTIQVCLGSELLVASLVLALVRPVMVPLVVAVIVSCGARSAGPSWVGLL